MVRRHLRRLYPDPVTNSLDWGLVRDFDGGSTGVYSRSERQPMKTSGFAPPWTDFAGATRYSGWQFVAEPAFFDSRSSTGETPATPPPTAPGPGTSTP